MRFFPGECLTGDINNYVYVLTFRFGPLRQHWTMRYEAKHSYFKKLTQCIGNFINLPYTLALRHEKLQCYHRLDKTDYQGHNLDVGPGMLCSIFKG